MNDLPLELISVDELDSLACFTEIKKMEETNTNRMFDADINKVWKVKVMHLFRENYEMKYSYAHLHTVYGNTHIYTVHMYIDTYMHIYMFVYLWSLNLKLWRDKC